MGIVPKNCNLVLHAVALVERIEIIKKVKKVEISRSVLEEKIDYVIVEIH